MEKIIKGNSEILNFLSDNELSHPHGTTEITQSKNNTIYIAFKNLTFSDSVRDITGNGVFKKTAENLILTETVKLDRDGVFQNNILLIPRIYSAID